MVALFGCEPTVNWGLSGPSGVSVTSASLLPAHMRAAEPTPVAGSCPVGCPLVGHALSLQAAGQPACHAAGLVYSKLRSCTMCIRCCARTLNFDLVHREPPDVSYHALGHWVWSIATNGCSQFEMSDGCKDRSGPVRGPFAPR